MTYPPQTAGGKSKRTWQSSNPSNEEFDPEKLKNESIY
jgi:hypothetical protein